MINQRHSSQLLLVKPRVENKLQNVSEAMRPGIWDNVRVMKEVNSCNVKLLLIVAMQCLKDSTT